MSETEAVEWESVPGEDHALPEESDRGDADAADASAGAGAVEDAGADEATVGDAGTGTVAAEYDAEDRVPTGRWEVGLTAALVAGAAGMLTSTPTMVAAAAVGLSYAAYGYATRPPALTVDVERRVSETAPLPGERVEVQVELENFGDRALPDLRVIDEVPEAFDLIEGTPGFSTTLEPGETVAYSYAVRARRGEHTLGPTALVSRNVSGGEERRRRMTDAVDLTVEAGPRTVPVQEQTIPHTGRIDTDEAGNGLEFHSTRQYHYGDPMNRIDWNQYARTNELTTINYREERTAVVTVMVDVRSTVAKARSPTEPDGVELGRYAAERMADSLLEHNDRVGVALYGEGAYLPPALGREQSLRAQRLLREGRSGGADDPNVVTTYSRQNVEFYRKHMRPEVQVMLVTPLVDDVPVELVTRLEAHGHPVTVLTPDVTAPDSPGSAVARIRRERRIADLRESGVRVLEWSPDEPLHTTMDRAQRRWST